MSTKKCERTKVPFFELLLTIAKKKKKKRLYLQERQHTLQLLSPLENEK